MSEQMREEFEAWAALHWLHCAHKPVKMLDGQYQINELQASWESWQASREAVVVELPWVHEGMMGLEFYDPEQVVKSIKAAGITVKS